MSRPPDHISSAETALFLDVDGTLVDIQEDPSSVRADAGLVAMLERLADELGGALALVSGRSLAEIDRVFAPSAFPAAGAHGSELRVDGYAPESDPPPTVPERVRREAESFVDDRSGLLLEHKSNGLSLHYRRAPELEAASRDFVQAQLEQLGDEFRLIDGKMVLEIAPRAHSKGEAIRTLLEHGPFRDRRPVFVGDDVTDEDGFLAANALDGLSVRVGDIEASAARYSLPDVAAVRRWLVRLHDQATTRKNRSNLTQ